MTLLRWASRASLAVALFAVASPALAQRPNVSDITGPNVSDITGPNVSDITGPNTSDITGSNTSDITGSNTSDITGTTTADARALRALQAGLDQNDVQDLASDIMPAYDVCAGGGDCANFNSLYEQSMDILSE